MLVEESEDDELLSLPVEFEADCCFFAPSAAFFKLQVTHYYLHLLGMYYRYHYTFLTIICNDNSYYN